MQKKRERGGVQQKIPSKLNNQDRCSSSMNHFFIYSLSYPPFSTFRDDAFFQMTNAVSREN